RHAASQILGRRLVTAESGPEGLPVRKVLVEEGLAVEKEYYVGITIDRERAKPVVITSAHGGVDIEEVSREHPELVFREYIEPVFGLQPFQARKLAYAVGVEQEMVRAFVDVLLKLHIVFLVSDLELAEINPLVKVEDDRFVALDAKMTIDDSALFRHDDLKKLSDISEMDPLDFEARNAGISYIKLKGNIGCMVNGAGLAMATMDLIKGAGGEPANFLDVGGGAGAGKIKAAFKVLLADTQVEAVLVNIFGGILRCDELAKGIADTARELEIKVPMVVRLEGTNSEEGARILKESGLGITFASSMREAGEMAVHMLRSNA
ncbi:MAG TPA: ADP-forming succinate--CoA ligase subunit beta, partial [Nitrospirota bacterium]|nr:ADP-forming succinate--CoA ligase subunit beta [Nitrospirota bacterium]